MSADENEAVLSWEQRVGIAIDVAQGQLVIR